MVAPALACAQTLQETILPELVVHAPASLAATFSNFEGRDIPQPPYTLPATDPDYGDIVIGTSVFYYVTEAGEEIGLARPLQSPGRTATLALALDSLGAPALGCLSPSDSTTDVANGAELAGKIALVTRGTCAFYLKARSAQRAGAVGYLVYNPSDREPDTALNMGGGTEGDEFIDIPGVFLPWDLASPIVEAVAAGESVVATIACDGYSSFRCLKTAAEGAPGATGAGLFLDGENPTSGAARLVVRVPAPEGVTVVAYDLLGREVAVLHDGLVTGTKSVTLPAGLPPGSYFVRAVGATFQQGQQVTILR